MVVKKFKGQRDAVDEGFLIVHPLDDVREQKVDVGQLGLMPMTSSVRFSLLLLRGYLILMTLLVVYKVFTLAHGA